jgi:hypothetical protein
MNTNLQRFLLCPIPEDQKPITLYLGIKENRSTNWTMLSEKKYQKQLIFYFCIFFLLICFIRFPQLQTFSYLIEWIIFNNIMSLVLLQLFLGTIFFRWNQVEKVFTSSQIFYEEGSWSDGQIWKKPEFIQTNDQLIITQKIGPILQRIIQTMFRLTLFILGFFLLLEIA